MFNEGDIKQSSTDKPVALGFEDRTPHLTVGYLWIASRNPGFSIRTVGTNTPVPNRMPCHSHKVHELAYKEQLTKPIPVTDENMWRVKIMAVSVQIGLFMKKERKRSRKTCLQQEEAY